MALYVCMYVTLCLCGNVSTIFRYFLMCAMDYMLWQEETTAIVGSVYSLSVCVHCSNTSLSSVSLSLYRVTHM